MRKTISLPGALFAFRVVYVAFIVTASFTTLLHAHEPGLPMIAGIPALAMLAGVEIVAAMLFLFRRTEVGACAALLAVYAVAAVLSVASGDWSLRFAYYAATAVFIALAARNLPDAIENTA